MLSLDLEEAADHQIRLRDAPLADLAVVRMVFESLVMRAFNGAPPSDVHAFVTRLLRPGDHGLDQIQVTAAIRAALGERTVKYRGFDAGTITGIWTTVAYQLVSDLRVKQAELGKMICQAEVDVEEAFDLVLTPAT
jgi:hypothetical protein